MSQIRSYIEYLIQTYPFTHFILKIDDGLTHGCYYELMMILDSGLLFGGTLYTHQKRIKKSI